MLVQKNSDLTEEYKLPVGGEVIAIKILKNTNTNKNVNENTNANTTTNTNTNTNTGEHRMQGRVAEDHSGRVGRRPSRHEDDRQVSAHL